MSRTAVSDYDLNRMMTHLDQMPRKLQTLIMLMTTMAIRANEAVSIDKEHDVGGLRWW